MPNQTINDDDTGFIKAKKIIGNIFNVVKRRYLSYVNNKNAYPMIEDAIA